MKNMLVVCGGKSAEHEVSILSVRNILSAIDKNQFQPVIIGISRSGSWYHLENEQLLQKLDKIEDNLPVEQLATLIREPRETKLITRGGKAIRIDIAFPVLHGPYGEDGTIQGLFEMMDLPYVGANVAASANGMDKSIFKNLMSQANIPVTPFVVADQPDTKFSYDALKTQLGSEIFFVKPAYMGSSVGVRKVKNAAELTAALEHAFQFSEKVLIEKYIKGQEIECAVLGNQHAKASTAAEIKPHHEFYSYEAKYLDPNGADLIIPAPIKQSVLEKVQQLSLAVFKAIGGHGMARVDFFVTDDDQVYVNEVNTIPGFTQISMYPKLWQHMGISYPELINKLIELALDQFERKQKITLIPDIK